MSIIADHDRQGLKGISLNRVSFNDVKLEPENFIGSPETDATEFISDFRLISSLNFSARCVGVAESLLKLARPYIMENQRDKYALPVIAYKWSELVMEQTAITFYFSGSVALMRNQNLSKSDAHRTKVFCSSTLQSVVSKVRMLTGGTGYASDDYTLLRQLNDAGSLALIDTPNDTLLTWAGLRDLGISK